MKLLIAIVMSGVILFSAFSIISLLLYLLTNGYAKETITGLIAIGAWAIFAKIWYDIHE
jgi:hypothetical protein